jgi:predicted DCC family thiol-disulfide oxidoreductase YuxK
MELQPEAVLLYNDECGVCRRIAARVRKSAARSHDDVRLLVRPIGDDPDALRVLNPELDIWDAYETIHIVMPDGSMRVGGEAVAEVFRRLPNTGWFTWSFTVGIFGIRPFQLVLNLGYAILADVRPVFGCESCGTPSVWLRPFEWLVSRLKTIWPGRSRPKSSTHFSGLVPR